MKKRSFRFRRPDEMEKYILFRAQRNSYVFLIAALTLWSLCESYRVYAYHTRLNILPCTLLVAAMAVQTLSRLVMTRNAVKDDEDSFETAPLLRLILFICAAAGVIVTIGAVMILTSIRI